MIEKDDEVAVETAKWRQQGVCPEEGKATPAYQIASHAVPAINTSKPGSHFVMGN